MQGRWKTCPQGRLDTEGRGGREWISEFKQMLHDGCVGVCWDMISHNYLPSLYTL